MVHLLDESPLAVRPATAWPVWHVDGYDAVRETMVQVLTAALGARQRWFLISDEDPNAEGSPRYPRALPPWDSVGPQQWEIPLALRPEDFVEAYLHHIGNYVLYQRDGGVLPGGLDGTLPWFGPACRRRQRERWSAEALVVGLRGDNVSATMVVHPDADYLVAVVVPPYAGPDFKRTS